MKRCHHNPSKLRRSLYEYILKEGCQGWEEMLEWEEVLEWEEMLEMGRCWISVFSYTRGLVTSHNFEIGSC
jgi:hypothetical protein